MLAAIVTSMTSNGTRILKPCLEYTARLEARRATVLRYERFDVRLGRLKLALLAICLGVGTFSFWLGAISAWWLVLPSAAFIVAAVFHERVIAAKISAAKGVRFYESGLARLDHRWIGQGLSSVPLVDDHHLYAADLDLFGPGSLFELMCTARTRAGQETLARWLSEPAARDEILARQEAVEELRYRLDLRELLASLEPYARASPEIEIITQWGIGPAEFQRPLRLLILLAAIMNLAALSGIAWLGLDRSLFLASLAISGALGLVSRGRVRHVLERAEHHRDELCAVSRLLHAMQRERLSSHKMVMLSAALNSGQSSSTARIAQLVRLLDLTLVKKIDLPAVLLLFWQWRLLIAPLSFVFWLTHLAFAVESWRLRCGPTIDSWLRTAGEFEALCALASYAYEHPDDPFPEIAEAGPVFDGVALQHPLMPASRCVPNTLSLDGERQLLVVSGSNMSGKSTLLRTVGINAVLALAGAPVRAKRLRLSVVAIGATLRLQDSLHKGSSAFDAEVQRIALVSRAASDAPALFLFDELFHGTNPHDRRIGAEALLRTLLDSQAIGLLTTHDPAMNELEAVLPHVGNVHFGHQLTDGVMSFDYRVHLGPARVANALSLMAAAGLIRQPPVSREPAQSRDVAAALPQGADDARDSSLVTSDATNGQALTWRAVAKGVFVFVRRLRI